MNSAQERLLRDRSPHPLDKSVERELALREQGHAIEVVADHVEGSRTDVVDTMARAS